MVKYPRDELQKLEIFMPLLLVEWCEANELGDAHAIYAAFERVCNKATIGLGKPGVT